VFDVIALSQVEMIYQAIEKIAEQDLLDLIEAKRAEGAQLDYKRELPGASDADKKEFLSDVSSFANASARGDWSSRAGCACLRTEV
jgi:hypothetical protein